MRPARFVKVKTQSDNASVSGVGAVSAVLLRHEQFLFRQTTPYIALMLNAVLPDLLWS